MSEPVRIPIIEPFPVVDEVLKGIVAIEPIGSLARWVWYAEQTVYDAGTPARVHIIKRRICIENTDMALPVQMALAYLGNHALVTAPIICRLPGLHH